MISIKDRYESKVTKEAGSCIDDIFQVCQLRTHSKHAEVIERVSLQKIENSINLLKSASILIDDEDTARPAISDILRAVCRQCRRKTRTFRVKSDLQSSHWHCSIKGLN